MPMMQWGSSLGLGVAPMDDAHREFVARLAALARAQPESMPAALECFVAHVATQFAQENAWMAAVGFPDCHRAEHERVLGLLRDMQRRVERGDTFVARQLIAELPGWLEQHVRGMDASLAAHLREAGFDFATGKAPAGAARGGCGCALAAGRDV